MDSLPPEAAPAATPARPARRWVKAVALAAASLFMLAVVTLSALWWWAGTSGSLATALGWIGQSQPIMAQGATGSLRSGGQIDQLVWEQGGLRVDARALTLAWQPWSLLQGTLKLQRIAAASVTVDDQRPPRTTPASAPTVLGLPIPISLDAFSVDQLQWNGATAFAASGISGRYEFTGAQHQLDLLGAQVASGRYNGRAIVSSSSPFVLDARLSGALTATLPKGNTLLPLAFQASASGPLAEFQVKADLQMAAQTPEGQKPPPTPPQASATARVTPWAAQPLPQADARFRDLDMAALWPNAPQTQLTGSASVRPLESAAPADSPGWLLQLDMTNQLPGPWDQQRLPLERLETQGEWRGGVGIVRTLKAQLGGGEILASGEWTPAPLAPPAASPMTTAPAAPAWTLQATLKQVNPALLHSQFAALPLNGVAAVRSQGAAIGFDASVQAAPGAAPKSLGRLVLRDASATGSWNPEQAGGTLVLSALQLRTDDAELTGQLEVQPAAQGGKGNLAFAAPGLHATVNGELRQTSGAGSLSLRGQDAAQALRWLQKLPGLPASLQAASAAGSADLQARWQGGWLDPALQAKLAVPSLDWRSTSPKPAAASGAAPARPPAGLLKIRDLNATLSGRLSQAQLGAQGRLEIDQRRIDLQLALDGGRVKPAGTGQKAFSASAWKGLLKQLTVRLEDPALGAGSWQLASRGAVPLSWTPTAAGGAFESGAGQAILTAPNAKVNATSPMPTQATLAWQPVRWRPGELLTAGSITGLPMAWIELLGGPQLAGAGLGGTLLLNGQWDARFSDRLALKASLTRSSGDLTVQTETAQGTSARVAAGVRQARLSLESVGDALTLALRWDSERAGTADGQLKTRLTRAPPGTGIGGWLWATDAPLNGQLRAQLPRLGVWSVLAPPGWRLRGALAADIAISGTRAAPRLAGELQANDMALRSVVDGIEFGNGRLRAQLDGTRMRISEFSLQGAGDKGTGGLLTAQGEAAWVDGRPQVLLTAKLARLRASIRTDRQVTVSGELQASLQGAQTELTGKLVVDQARILLPDEGTPQLGDDVVVRMAGGAAAGPKGPGRASAPEKEKAVRPLKLAVQIDLGRDFRIQGKGMDTRIRGALSLHDDAVRGPRLTGTVNTFGGQYRAYGQRLDVEQGVIRFTGAIDNPTLDILAIRPNLTQRVGVQITGTALLPSVRLYAQPELPDAEKLSWLVVGRASASGGAEAALLQQAALALLGSKSGGMSGGLAASLGLDELSFRGASSNADGSTAAGAITLGKRFSSNFYAAYERSISGALGTLYVFYDLSQRFTIRAQAGQQSAVDLIYTVPYD
ncbi:MAG: translocation/assembly module TamB domain-containing protein [Polaromonas sp.]|uniref:translocation/assembly module TamB domain-containing protein n=1 Tax=Polaromonas sp. TaxID=1869339 RepID=UPI00273009BC|nr:translocation/assembly module TamB domain-containing protein [Polaromonas sp.]MDP2256477.1 translocation/assembly module TamB domain-containing protein [Polaromonas sp.]